MQCHSCLFFLIQQLLDGKFATILLHNDSMYSAAEHNLVIAALEQCRLIGDAYDALLHVSNAAVLK